MSDPTPPVSPLTAAEVDGCPCEACGAPLPHDAPLACIAHLQQECATLASALATTENVLMGVEAELAEALRARDAELAGLRARVRDTPEAPPCSP